MTELKAAVKEGEDHLIAYFRPAALLEQHEFAHAIAYEQYLN